MQLKNSMYENTGTPYAAGAVNTDRVSNKDIKLLASHSECKQNLDESPNPVASCR